MKMKLRIKEGNSLRLLKPSRMHRRLTNNSSGLAWGETLERGNGRKLFPREVEIDSGCYEIERVENPFIRGGEPWLVLKGGRIGAAEAYLRQLAEATRGTNNGVEVICE